MNRKHAIIIFVSFTLLIFISFYYPINLLFCSTLETMHELSVGEKHFIFIL